MMFLCYFYIIFLEYSNNRIMKQTISTVPRIEKELSKAKTKEEIEKLLSICDQLHEAITNDIIISEGYTIQDIPSDEIYEQYSLKINHVNKFSDVVKCPIMFMGSVYKPKPDENIVINNIILTPKYDGTSLAIRLIKIKNVFYVAESHTKGREVGGKHVNQNVTDKIRYFIKSIDIKNTKKAIETFKDVEEIHIRGEFICRHKICDEEGNPIACHANVASGQINRLFKEFKNGLENFDFVGYEIAKIYRKINDKKIEFIPTQIQAIQLLKMLIINYELNEPSIVYSGNYWIANNSVDVDYPSTYEEILDSEQHPTDGIVYCERTWTYPTEESAFKSKFYGKYAWKPQSEKHVIVSGLEYSMSKNGDINFNILYEPIQINGKTYSRAKTGTNKLKYFIDNGLGKNAVCVLELKNDVMPYISTIITPSDQTFKMLLKCPFCNQELIYLYDKDNELRHIRCENNNCGDLLITKWTKFISSMNKIYKQNNGTILPTYNDLGKQIKSAISETKLRTIANEKKLTISTIEEYMPTIFDEFEKLDLETQLIVLGYGGKLEVQKMIRENNYESLCAVPDVWIYQE